MGFELSLPMGLGNLGELLLKHLALIMAIVAMVAAIDGSCFLSIQE